MSVPKATLLVCGNISALAVLCSLASGCADQPPPAPPAPTVQVAAPLFQTIRPWSDFTGRIEAIQNVELRPRVGGFIDQVYFAEGAAVRRGQVLYQIDPRPFQAEVTRLRGELARAQAVARQTQLEDARAKREMAQNAISQSDLEQADAQAKSAAAQVMTARGSLDAAQLNLGYARVVSPIDGRISKKRITRGNLVTTSDILTTIVSDNPVYVSFVADEQAFLRFAGAQRGHNAPVYVGLAGDTGFPHPGILEFLDNAVDPGSGTIAARAVLANRDGRLTPGLFAHVRLASETPMRVALVPEEALGTDLGKRFVLVLDTHKHVQYRSVELGASIDGLRVVRRGLSPSDIVVVSGLQHVKPGDAVSPQKVPTPRPPAELAQISGA